VAPAAPRPVLEFDIAAAELPKLMRQPALSARRDGRTRTARLSVVRHDSADATLQKHHLALAEEAGLWRLERLVPNGAADWAPASPAPVLAEAISPDLFTEKLPQHVVPVAAFTGTRRTYPLTVGNAPARLEVLEGALRGVARDQAACRVVFSGPPAAMAALVTELAEQVVIDVPRAGLAAGAIAVARGEQPAPRHLGAPDVTPGLNVGEAMVLVTGHLTDVILHWAPIAPLGEIPEPVHQMRVAVRRLRSALALFRRAAAGADWGDLGHQMKVLADRLGAARDWDVFTTGTGHDVQTAFAGDKRVAALLAAAGRKRLAAYADLRDYLAGETWRKLSLRLALLPTAQPWVDAADPAQAEMLAGPAASYAAHALRRQHRRLVQAGADFETLPPDAVHDVRKHAKKLRYAVEFFAPLFAAKPARRFLERLEVVQEALGTVNDSHVAAELMAQLGGGADRAFAAGAVQGYLAAHRAKAASGSTKAWSKFVHQDVFWD
jgi:triphosphatase